MDRMLALERRYRKFFSIEEIEQSLVLQWLFGAMLFFFFLTFSRYIATDLTTLETAARGAAVCWPYFESCGNLYFLSGLPYGYTQSEFYMALYAVLLLIVYCMWKKEWTRAHVLMSVLWLWKMFVVFGLSYLLSGPYDYYHVILTAVLLFVPFKEYFTKLSFVLFYFMSVTPKFDGTWVLGSYFTAMKTGLPIFPTALTPLFTNLVIFSQVILCWFLLSANWLRQRVALAFFTIFHLYSGILVYYLYPSVTLPALLILFGPLYRHTPIPFSRKALGGWTIVVLVMIFQLLGFIIPSDRRMTLEGNRFGMFMFEANHQCIAHIRTYTANKQVANTSEDTFSCNGFYCLTKTRTYMEGGQAVRERTYESASAWNRCDPYEWWSKLHTICGLDTSVSRVAFRFDHSINGGPFYRIVDVPNICDLTYKPFVHNPWIHEPPVAPLVGYPVQNVYSY